MGNIVLLGVRGSERRGGPPVVPLIGRTRWRGPGPASVPVPVSGSRVEDAEEAAVVSKAVQELIEESRRFQDKGGEGNGDDGTLDIPLLMQNHAPPGYEDGDTVNVGLRPEP
ncbi:G-patch domain and KOW motifs-containing protein, partial [Leucoraja erinacea]|uniref:G-patch domain and KOW motifs-containing protein n=1 Tax=Leucoraja erinaceus TaxID=7782 RepID=UPI002453968A